jgi:AraC-like DNA-binding protein
MTVLRYHEDKQRGSPDFPLDYHLVKEGHNRYEMPYHWHEEVEIIHVMQGKLRLSTGGVSHALQKGDIAFIASGMLHGGKPENCVYECVVFDMNLLLMNNSYFKQQIGEVLDGAVEIRTHLRAESGETWRALLPMFGALREWSEGCRMITIGCLMRFVGEVYRSGAYTRREHPRGSENRKMLKLKKVFMLIENSYAKPLTLGQLSAAVDMTPKYFCRFFKEATHRTPLDYVTYYRVEAACHAFAATDHNVTEIALDMGFSDVSYFIRCFKKYKGVTPGRYRRTLRDGLSS